MDGNVGRVRLQRGLHRLHRALAATGAANTQLQRLKHSREVARIEVEAQFSGNLDKKLAQRQRPQLVAVRLGDTEQRGAREQMAAVFIQIVVRDQLNQQRDSLKTRVVAEQRRQQFGGPA